jgi:hypothetical protein
MVRTDRRFSGQDMGFTRAGSEDILGSEELLS